MKPSGFDGQGGALIRCICWFAIRLDHVRQSPTCIIPARIHASSKNTYKATQVIRIQRVVVVNETQITPKSGIVNPRASAHEKNSPPFGIEVSWRKTVANGPNAVAIPASITCPEDRLPGCSHVTNK